MEEQNIHIFTYDTPDELVDKYNSLGNSMEKALRKTLISSYEVNIYFTGGIPMKYILEFIIWRYK